MEEFKPSNWEIKPFDLKKINDIKVNHPYQKIMILVYKYYCPYVDGFPGDILNEVDYFKVLDNYYRYGISFQKKHELYPENVLYVHEDFKENPSFIYIVGNNYNLKQLLFNDVKKN